MSSKAAEARESFLRRLEQQNQQQRQQQEKEEGKAEEKEESSSNKEGDGTNDNVKESDNVQVLKPTAVVEDVTKKTKERDATTKSSTTKDKKVPQLEEEESKQETTQTFFNTPAPPPSFSTSKEVEEERLILKSIVKSCGLSQVSELGSIDPSSLKLLRTLSTPRVKRHLSDKKSKSTSAKAQHKDEEKGKKVIPRNIDFDAEKEEEKQKEAPFHEIALDKSVALNRTTSDLTAFNTDPSKLETSLSLINDDHDSSDTEDDDDEDELIEQEEDVNTEATTAGSKQQQDELIRRHRRRSKRQLLPTEKSTKTITTSNVKVDVETLEPWQQHLFDMLKQQQEEMKEMSEKIDNLTAMVHCQQVYSNNHHQQHLRRDFDVQQHQHQQGGWEQHESYRPNEYPFQYSSSDQQPPTQQQQQQDTTSPPSSPNPPTNLPPQRPYTQPQPQLPNFIILPLLTKLFTFLFSIPTSIYTYLTTTRFVRIFTCFVREARRRNDVHANLDIHLLFKLLFVCFLFGGRISSSSSSANNKKDEKKSLSAFLDYYRMYIFVGVGIVVYLIQSGIAGFVYEFFWKGDYVRMIWNNEDLKEEGEEEEGEDGIGDGQQGDGEGDGNEGQRRGQQDHDGPDNNNNNNNEDGIAARGEGGIVARRRRRVRTIADGGIRRRPLPLAEGGHGENVAISFLHDVKYLVGGLFLSLLPTWRPELVEDEEEDGEGGQAEGAGGAGEAVVAVDGGNDGQNNDGN